MLRKGRFLTRREWAKRIRSRGNLEGQAKKR